MKKILILMILTSLLSCKHEAALKIGQCTQVARDDGAYWKIIYVDTSDGSYTVKGIHGSPTGWKWWENGRTKIFDMKRFDNQIKTGNYIVTSCPLGF